MKEQYVRDLQEAGFTEAEANVAYETFITRIKTEVSTGDGYARITGIGSFTRKLVPQRQYSNPRNRENVIVKPAHFTIKFSLSKTFKAAMPTP